MYCSITTGAMVGLSCHTVCVEVDTAPGLPCFQMVGLPSGEVREAKERVRVALKNTGIKLPAMCININLSPADIRKEGTSYDLPIAIGILISLGEFPASCMENTLAIGEIGLNGEVRGVKGILPIVMDARSKNISRVILPKDNLSEAKLIPGIEAIGISCLFELYDYLNDKDNIPTNTDSSSTVNIADYLEAGLDSLPDFSDVKGQSAVKQAAMIAAAGFHHMLMIGPPGSGKTMIAERIPSILPKLTPEEALEITSIYSVAGLLNHKDILITSRPFMAPHNSVTEPALTGGGRVPKPGAITLAHRGVLFLDEITEFDRNTLDLLRQPLESKEIFISRSQGTFKYPADFMLVAACNPCPCGYYPNRNKCNCNESTVKRYLGRISGPMLDRIDICCDVQPVTLCKPDANSSINNTHLTEMSSSQMRDKISIARERQKIRFKDSSYIFNSEIPSKDIDKFCALDSAAKQMMESAYESLSLSARSYHRILRVARTVADLSDNEHITEENLSEAIFYRTSGLRFWGR